MGGEAILRPGVNAIKYEEIEKAKPWIITYLRHNLINYFKNKYENPDMESILEVINEELHFWFEKDDWFKIENLLNLAGHGLTGLLTKHDLTKEEHERTNLIKKYYKIKEKPEFYLKEPLEMNAINEKHASKARTWFRDYLYERVHSHFSCELQVKFFPEYHEKLKAYDDEYIHECFNYLNKVNEIGFNEVEKLFGDKVEPQRIIPNLLKLAYQGILNCIGENDLFERTSGIDEILSEIPNTH